MGQGKTYKTRQDNPRQDKTAQEHIRKTHDNTIQGSPIHYKTR